MCNALDDECCSDPLPRHNYVVFGTGTPFSFSRLIFCRVAAYVDCCSNGLELSLLTSLTVYSRLVKAASIIYIYYYIYRHNEAFHL